MNYLLKNSVYLHVNLAFKQQQQKNHLTGTTNSDLKIQPYQSEKTQLVCFPANTKITES